MKQREKAERNARNQVAEAQQKSIKDEIAKQVQCSCRTQELPPRFSVHVMPMSPQAHNVKLAVLVSISVRCLRPVAPPTVAESSSTV